MSSTCKICAGKSEELFSALVLGKYRTAYVRCTHCGFLQIDEPFWLEEAYSSAIASTDIGLVSRNIIQSDMVAGWLGRGMVDPDGRFVDYGGGFGLFVRLMRDKGFDFYRQDKYCENLFAKYWDVSLLSGTEKFGVLTAFEVFEHLSDPMQAMEEMLAYSDTIVFSTDLQPPSIRDAADWWYIAPEVGQHVAFYTLRALQAACSNLKLKLYSDGIRTHVVSRGALPFDPFDPGVLARLKRTFSERSVKRTALTDSDFQVAKRAALDQRN